MNPVEDQEERVFDETIFKEHLRTKIILLLDSIPGKKILLIENCVAGPLNLSIDHSIMKEHGVHKIFYLDSDEIEPEVKEVIFFITPKVSLMNRISNIITKSEKNNLNQNFTLIFWPRRTILCKEALEYLGVFGNLTIRDFSFDLIPLDFDLLSLEMEHSFKDVFVEGDLSLFTYVAESIQRLQLVYGRIPNIFAKGHGSKVVIDILTNSEKDGRKYDEGKADIDTIILLDRSVDWVTPLCTQLTYLGLIDEIFGVKNNYVLLDPKILNKEGDKPFTIPLTSQDSTFNECRDLNFGVLRNVLSEKVAHFQKIIEEKNEDKTVQEMNVYLQKFKKVQKDYSSVTNHINIADKISSEMKSPAFYRNLNLEQGILIGAKATPCLDHLEVSIALNAPFQKVLRLLCLQSLVDNGIKGKTYDFLKREILHSYGFNAILVLSNLEKLGILKKNESKSNWSSIEKNLKLINVDVRQDIPNDSAYAYSGYSPITVRLIEYCFKKNHWKSIGDSLKNLSGPTIYNDKLITDKSVHKNRPVVIVYFLGGVTFGEIAAIRYLAKTYKKEIVICTTQIINGNAMLNCMKENLEDNN